MPSMAGLGPLPQHTLLAIIWTCFSVAFLFMSLRTIIRLRIMPLARRFTFEDGWLLLSLAALLAFCILETIQLPSLYYISTVIDGPLRLSADLVTHTERYLRFQFPIVILFWTVLWCVKAGFLALYFKLFKELVLYRRVWYALSLFTLLAYVGAVLTLALSCGSVDNFFQFAGCASKEDIWKSNLSVYYSTAVDIFTDLCIMAMPLRLIWGARITPRQKIGLACVFGLGFVMIAFAIIRANQILQQQYFVNLTLLIVWSTLTASISVIVGSLPALKIFFTNRAGKRSRNSPGNGSSKHQFSDIESRGGEGVPLSSLSSDKDTTGRRRPETGDSQQNMLQSEPAPVVVVQHDVTVSYTDVNRPRPVYHNHPNAPGYGNAF